MSHHGWIGVDLDGTLAKYTGWTGSHLDIGEPIPLMQRRVKEWVAQGKDVRIMTARVNPHQNLVMEPDERIKYLEEVRSVIELWCLDHIGQILPITCMKDYSMIELWDDRVIQVVPNTGERVDGKR